MQVSFRIIAPALAAGRWLLWCWRAWRPLGGFGFNALGGFPVLVRAPLRGGTLLRGGLRPPQLSRPARAAVFSVGVASAFLLVNPFVRPAGDGHPRATGRVAC